MPQITELARQVGVGRACAALGVPRSSYYRFLKPKTVTATDPSPPTRAPHPRALTADEQAAVRAELNSERFVDATPRTIYDRLLQEGQVRCHWSTMYRLLRADGACRERRAIRRRRSSTKPELLAIAPNQVWSWDITLLRGPQPGVWYRLYLVLDIFSRTVMGWLVATHETAELAEQLLADACLDAGIARDHVTIHADRGAAMTSQTVANLVQDLGVGRSHSRPSVSNDNAFSEAQFKTLKYGPSYPDRFASLDDAETWVERFVTWYNTEHHHSGIGFLTPTQHHRGEGAAITAARQQVLDAAYATHPERFVRGRPLAPRIPTEAWINPPTATIISSVAPASPPNPTGGQGSQLPQQPLDAQAGSAILPGNTDEEAGRTTSSGRNWSKDGLKTY
jgi:putative transposase